MYKLKKSEHAFALFTSEVLVFILTALIFVIFVEGFNGGGGPFDG